MDGLIPVPRKLSSAGAEALWRAFGETIGLEALRAAYGPYWPRPAMPDEMVLVFEAAVRWDRSCQQPGASDPMAWGSARPDPVDPVVWIATGVWPQYQRAGLVGRIRDALMARARARWPERLLMASVLKSNTPHLERLRRQTPSGWREVGYRDVPAPGEVFFAFQAPPSMSSAAVAMHSGGSKAALP